MKRTFNFSDVNARLDKDLQKALAAPTLSFREQRKRLRDYQLAKRRMRQIESEAREVAANDPAPHEEIMDIARELLSYARPGSI